MKSRYLIPGLLAAILLAVLGAYRNHFHNAFHFDDFHSITGNLFLEDLRNVPRFFVDPMVSSTMPDHAMYRPVVTASLALDYRLARGYQPFWFHVSTFFWFLVLLVLMFFLFRRLMCASSPGVSSAEWAALAATACFGLHPAIAETVNYVIQRADLYSTLGVVASLLCFIAWPARRKQCWYLLPALAACLSKAPALIFPFIFLAYVWIFEEKRWRSTIPAFIAGAAAAILTVKMTPPSFQAGAASDSLYRLTQPWIALHYFRSFFLPTQLSADTDWTYIDPTGGQAFAGYVFVIALLAAAYFAARRKETRPIAFGLLWFLLALAPTSLMPLGEVTNDHRMFFPFVGLTLAVMWSLYLVTPARAPISILAPVLIVILAAEAVGTHRRNEVWRTEETLWQDVAQKSPHNARGLMNYGITFMPRDYTSALIYLIRAEALMPTYYAIEFNLGRAYAGLHRDTDAEAHFQHAIELSPRSAEPYVYYAEWLASRSRLADAQTQLESVLKFDPAYFPARKQLIEVYTRRKNWKARDRLVEESLRLSHDDDLARRYHEERATPEALLNLSARYCNAGNYTECLAAAQSAIEMRPSFAEAYNNAAAAYIALQQWDEGIQAARQALRLKPDYQDAKSNLDWALAHRPR